MWLYALKSLTPKALESGIERIVNFSAGKKFMEFPPGCLEFKGLCLDFYDDLKLPKAEDAYREIQNSIFSKNKIWSHKVVRYVANCLPANFFSIEHDVRNALFYQAYKQVCNLLKQGHELPQVEDRVFINEVSSKEMAAHHLKEIRQILAA